MEKNEITGLSEVRKNAEEMKTGAAVYKGIESKPSQLHNFKPDGSVEFVQTAKENLVHAVKTEFNRDPDFKQRLIKALNVEPIETSDGLLPPVKEQTTEQATPESV